MLVRRLVIGVRSSCEASATSWRWAAIERSSVSSIALKCSASSPTSSWVSTSIRRARSSVAAMWRAASVTWTIGATTLRETSRPSATASATPPRMTSSRIQPQARPGRRPRPRASARTGTRRVAARRGKPRPVVSTRTCDAADASRRRSTPGRRPRRRRARVSSTGSAWRSRRAARARCRLVSMTWMNGVGPPSPDRQRAEARRAAPGAAGPAPKPAAGSCSARSTSEISWSRTAM